MKTVVVSPEATLELLSIDEMAWLGREARAGQEHDLLRRCALAVLNCGIETDDANALWCSHDDFDLQVKWHNKGLRFELVNPPSCAFVDGSMIRGVRENLTSVVRDLIYSRRLIQESPHLPISVQIFRLLRNADAFLPGLEPHLVVCWGGHSISDDEYRYSKMVGYELGLRGLNICTGCGPGAMKGPMKGAAIAHVKQRIFNPLYLGLTEPGIIAAEAPNPIVSKLVILPDIEKRLEAFARVAHGIVVFPGGVGTVEELLFLLGVLMHPDNKDVPFPLVLTGPDSAGDYFRNLDRFIRQTLGEEATKHYQIVVGDASQVARIISQGIRNVTEHRLQNDEAFHYHWRLHVAPDWQEHFEVTHESMAALNLSPDQPGHQLALNLRRLFSGIVTGNVKPEGVSMIQAKGPFEIHASKAFIEPLESLLGAFVEQQRMVLPQRTYKPCYRLIEA